MYLSTIYHLTSSADPRKLKEECQCPPCIKKRINLTHAEPYKGLKSFLTKITLIGGWALLIFLAYKVSQFDYEMSNFDPYEILSIDFGASDADIKRSYRKLSVIYHPDKETGDAKEFMRITKAYKALTDEEAKKNWDKYGNPDGPGAMSFGIALPSWIVEKENSVWVLGLYALVFMVALPTAVGTWWYRSIRFSGDKVLLDTTQMYFYFLHKTPQMAPKRAINDSGGQPGVQQAAQLAGRGATQRQRRGSSGKWSHWSGKFLDIVFQRGFYSFNCS